MIGQSVIWIHTTRSARQTQWPLDMDRERNVRRGRRLSLCETAIVSTRSSESALRRGLRIDRLYVDPDRLPYTRPRRTEERRPLPACERRVVFAGPPDEANARFTTVNIPAGSDTKAKRRSGSPHRGRVAGVAPVGAHGDACRDRVRFFTKQAVTEIESEGDQRDRKPARKQCPAAGAKRDSGPARSTNGRPNET